MSKRPFVRGKRGTYVSAPKEERRTSKTGWDEMAPWYAGWAGGGSTFHKQFAIPAVVEALTAARPKGGALAVIDLGCGLGVLREAVEKLGGTYTGVDKSPTMIREAKRKGGKAQFYISDVARPGGVALPVTEKYDRAVFMFSIQDVDDHRAAFKNAAALLKSGGELVVFMVHPAFRIPRQSGWGTDPKRKLTYRRIDRYKSEVTIPLPQRTGDTQTTSFFYHRPLESYIGALRDAGFVVADLREIYSGTKDAETEFPHFMLIRAAVK